MKYYPYVILLMIVFSFFSCVDQEKVLNERYVNLSEPQYHGDSVRVYKMLKIHKKLLKKQPDNLIYLGNVFQTNCLLGKYEDNIDLITNHYETEDPSINSKVYRNFYMALNEFREDPKSDYQKYLNVILEEDLSHNPLLGYIAARCTNHEELADMYYPLMQEFIYFMPERSIIRRMINSDRCDRFLELYRGICPVCEICNSRYII